VMQGGRGQGETVRAGPEWAYRPVSMPMQKPLLSDRGLAVGVAS